jgi:hypothetical protein
MYLTTKLIFRIYLHFLSNRQYPLAALDSQAFSRDDLRLVPVKCYCMRRFSIGEVSELADEHDLGSCALKGVGVRVPPSPPNVPAEAAIEVCMKAAFAIL